MSPLHVEARSEIWPLKDAFTISRGSKTTAEVVVAEVSDGRLLGRGEAVPYARYGETVAGVLHQIAEAADGLLSHADLGRRLRPGAALNALDCALWDLEAKRSGRRVAELAGLKPPIPKETAYTLSLDTAAKMAEKAKSVANLPLLKLKLGGPSDAERMHAVRQARPDARLIADANEAWGSAELPELLAAAAECRFEMIEQPLPADADELLRSIRHELPICADESVHTVADLARLDGRYDAVNVKLDKAGGLTGAIALVHAAHTRGFKIMVGSMVATSLAVAPAMLLAPEADWIDLDGPLLLARDRDPALKIENGIAFPPPPELWG